MSAPPGGEEVNIERPTSNVQHRRESACICAIGDSPRLRGVGGECCPAEPDLREAQGERQKEGLQLGGGLIHSRE